MDWDAARGGLGSTRKGGAKESVRIGCKKFGLPQVEEEAKAGEQIYAETLHSCLKKR